MQVLRTKPKDQKKLHRNLFEKIKEPNQNVEHLATSYESNILEAKVVFLMGN